LVRLLLPLVAVLAPALALAQSNPGKERSDLMRSMQDQYNALRSVVQGKQGFDPHAVEQAFAILVNAAEKLPPLWPAGSESVSQRYASSPRGWETRADFDAKLASLQRVLATSRPKASTLEGLNAAVPEVNRACDSCHETYRVRR